MINEKQIELLTKRLIDRIDKANTYFLMSIGKSIKQIKKLTPTQAHELVQILKYGGRYEEIIQEMTRYTNMNYKDIEDIFREYAKKDQQFYKQFYEYRNKPFIEYDKNPLIKNQVEAYTRIAQQDLYNYTRSNVLGYMIRDTEGVLQFTGLRETFNRVLDEAVLNIGQGKETFDNAMYNLIKDIGGNGLKTIEYKSGRTMRLDSAIRMYMQTELRDLHNANQMIYGEEFDADGVEISHHSNAAPDHIDSIDGKQFARIDIIKEQINKGIEKEIKLSDIQGNRVKVKGKWYKDFDYVNNNLARPVSKLNCRHYTWSIIVGVSKPEYTQEQLNNDKKKNLEGFELDGKHYTNYEGTQLQRQLETKIREQKDIQILGKASGNKELLYKSQDKIRLLTNKYKELSDVSGLPTETQRLRVSQYRRKAGDTRSFYEKNLLGKTYGDITISGVSKHLLDRKTSRSLWLEDIEDGLSKPLKITDVKIDSEGRQSLQYIGERATIVLNPVNGNIVSVWKTGSNRVKKIRGEK